MKAEERHTRPSRVHAVARRADRGARGRSKDCQVYRARSIGRDEADVLPYRFQVASSGKSLEDPLKGSS